MLRSPSKILGSLALPAAGRALLGAVALIAACSAESPPPPVFASPDAEIQPVALPDGQPTLIEQDAGAREAAVSSVEGGGQPGSSKEAGSTPGTCPVTDVPPSSPYRAAVCWAVTQQIIEAPGGLFKPDDGLERALMARHLVLLKHGSSFTASKTPLFDDVPASDPSFAYVQRLAEDLITVGCTVQGKSFCPHQLGTNAHAASLAVRTKHGPSFAPASSSPYFVDVTPQHWAFTAVQLLLEDKAASSCAAQKYCPDTAIPRGRWAMLLHDYLK